MSAEWKDRILNCGISAELVGKKKVKLTYPSGNVETISIPSKAQKGISNNELMAISTMQLVIPTEFPEETTGVDQAGFRVEREKNIHDLPGDRENDYDSALRWAGAILQREGWSAGTVGGIIYYELPSNPAAGEHLGTLTKEMIVTQKARLSSAIAEKYPGAAASRKRRIDKNVPDW